VGGRGTPLRRDERDPRGPESRGDRVGSASRVMGRMGALGVAIIRVRGGNLGGDRRQQAASSRAGSTGPHADIIDVEDHMTQDQA
jgi:hypothetical protein